MRCPKCKHEWIAFGQKPRVSDNRIREAMKQSKGNAAHAARLTGMKVVSLYARICKLGIKSTGYKKKHRYEHISNDDISKAWLDFGDQGRAASSLKMSLPAFRSRLQDVKEYRDNPRRFSGNNPRVRTVKMLVKALAEHDGNYSETALALGVSRQRIQQLVERDVIGGLVENA